MSPDVECRRLNRNVGWVFSAPEAAITRETLRLPHEGPARGLVTQTKSQLGLIRSREGLDRVAATEAFAAFLDQTRFSVEQVRFVQLIIDELTANGVMEPSRLYESPYIDHGHLDVIFPQEVGLIVKILRDVKAHALPADVA
jgi:type I restriction enzyme, R subunit